MKDTINQTDKGLSIKELENRMELSVTSSGAEMEVAKGDRCCACTDMHDLIDVASDYNS